MSASPNLKLPFLDPNQNQKTVTHNAALTVLDALVNLHVASTTLQAPPASPSDGQCWIVAAGATGAWLGKDLNVAAWQDGAWSFYAPNPGFVAYVDAIGGALMWNGSAWVSLIQAITQLTLTGLGLGTALDPSNPLSAKLNAALFAAVPTTASPAGTGDVRVKLSKQATGNTASLLFQDNYAGRAEIGLVGDDNFHFKVSPDGSTFYDAMVVAAAGGGVTFLGTPAHPTPAAGDNSAKSATTAFVAASFVTYAYAAATYVTAASPTLTGTPTAPTPGQNDNSTKLATTAYADRAAGALIARKQVGDAAYAVATADRTVAVTALTAARVLTLPAAAAFPQGATLTVVDESGACSAVNTLTIAAAGSDTINGAASAVLSAPFGYLALESNTSNKWTVIDQPSGSVAALNGSALAGQRNRVINGNFAVNQRAYATGGTLAAGSYAHDRWKAGSGGCTYTYAAATPDTTLTITAGTLQQIVETVNVEGGVYTLSWAGSSTARVTYTATGAGSTTTTAYAASPIVLPAVNAGLVVTVEFGTGTLGKVQLEPGPTPTPFERRPLGIELALCQRYFEKSYNQADPPGTATQSGCAAIFTIGGLPSYAYLAGSSVFFKTSKRGVPTITFFSPRTGAAGKAGDYSNAVDVTATASGPGESGFTWYGTISAAATQYNIQSHWTASAEL